MSLIKPRLRLIPGATEIIIGESDDINATRVSIYELIKDGTPSVIFRSLLVDLNSICFKWEEITRFGEQHRECLNSPYKDTLLLTNDHDDFLYRRLSIDGDGMLHDIPYDISYRQVYSVSSRARFVIPQQHGVHLTLA